MSTVSDTLTLLILSGDLADLIFVFFDPIGQALCKRTLNVVEELSAKHADRMRFYLSKVMSGLVCRKTPRPSLEHSLWKLFNMK